MTEWRLRYLLRIEYTPEEMKITNTKELYKWSRCRSGIFHPEFQELLAVVAVPKLTNLASATTLETVWSWLKDHRHIVLFKRDEIPL